mmetsp:Transcript_2471/g.3639  ORF Transcript_2471/g.3639 Transcript_2471/m.3639 type:complete len:177 (+) Transcript_2471:61-591(+)
MMMKNNMVERSSSSLLLLLLLVVVVVASSSSSHAAFVPTTKSSLFRLASTSTTDEESSSGVTVLSLDVLGDNHDQVGSEIATSVTAWLDAEWIPQQVHIDMAESVKKSYVRGRMAGEEQIMEIMMRVQEELSENWMEKYDADAFVNAWDVANYVSDYLSTKALQGEEGCGCTSEIY